MLLLLQCDSCSSTSRLLPWVHPAWTGSDGGKLWLVVVSLSISISISMSLLEQLPQWCFSLWLLVEKPSERLPNFNLMLFQFFWRFFVVVVFVTTLTNNIFESLNCCCCCCALSLSSSSSLPLPPFLSLLLSLSPSLSLFLSPSQFDDVVSSWHISWRWHHGAAAAYQDLGVSGPIRRRQGFKWKQTHFSFLPSSLPDRNLNKMSTWSRRFFKTSPSWGYSCCSWRFSQIKVGTARQKLPFNKVSVHFSKWNAASETSGGD